MLIRSQDKTKTTTDLNLFIDVKEVGTSNTIMAFIKNVSTDILGSYSSREKAIKVLDMIEESYKNANNGYGYVENTVFQMPKDNEVE